MRLPTGSRERAERAALEREAKRINDAIDAQLEFERGELKRRRGDTRVVLLGPTESGKSTLLKNFQLHFAPKAFTSEVDAWKAIIFLNIAKTVNYILDLMAATLNNDDFPPSPGLTEQMDRFRVWLSPMRELEDTLYKRVSGKDWVDPLKNSDRAISEVCVRSGRQWKTLLNPLPHHEARWGNFEREQKIIHESRDYIDRLWANRAVRHILKNRGVSLGKQAGFFLSEIQRIGSVEYVPSPDDILRARLKTYGVEAHRVKPERLTESMQDWVIYDLGGTRGQRLAWDQFFDDVDIIIFIAPVNVFDEVYDLDQGMQVNKLEETLNTWQHVCQNKVLQNTPIVLMLNKTDLLDQKLKSGTPFVHYVPSYKNSNTATDVLKFLEAKFRSKHHKYTPNKQRKLYPHRTCAININAMSIIVRKVSEAILQENLIKAQLV